MFVQLNSTQYRPPANAHSKALKTQMHFCSAHYQLVKVKLCQDKPRAKFQILAKSSKIFQILAKNFKVAFGKFYSILDKMLN